MHWRTLKDPSAALNWDQSGGGKILRISGAVGFELNGSKDIVQTGATLFSDSWNWHARLFVRVLLEKAKTLILPELFPPRPLPQNNSQLRQHLVSPVG
jgi:hypothetical protein